MNILEMWNLIKNDLNNKKIREDKILNDMAQVLFYYMDDIDDGGIEEIKDMEFDDYIQKLYLAII